ncbi:MAG: 4-demethylwyosine synthase TYW1 [Candidatus Nanoarchaeia archaeon]|nr:4-demethylwyosine synthase TYW1 [Candidatus Haiyanarchaeum thermophilum]MCW1303073.1 4-demethylwyosine synthase TYW1 [Candidatus Haiyanarchaeum thermophilum]MCW1303738.1 4-demethylwyosine synthase TYW1 [Candidatus Haiyanarchaeum thermophilum]MCW1306817.1 4-demethylwyosine synthase TYW1 [Candidatus Haiyanarchaeum thermophilum]MCW1307059.1 4-demethylwyosine synthase TYW1 [Candidatus Haiyanarchaeum thermophilum]
MEKIRISGRVLEKLKKAHYGVFGHSAVEICLWNKKAIRGEGVCYKRKFFGIETHRCMQFSPAAAYCENRCIYCWRFSEFYRILNMPEEAVDDPQEIIENLMRERRRLLSGFFGNVKANKELLKEAMIPSHFAISLIGEPTLYPKLPKMIKYLKSLPHTRSVFLVTNGQEPQMLKRLEAERALPTQLYLSLNAGSMEKFREINRPLLPDAWERFWESLEFLRKNEVRSVIRVTLIKSLNTNEEELEKMCELIKVANPNFVEVKSYMHLGYSTRRLSKTNMLTQLELKKCINKMLKHLRFFKYMDEQEESRVIILQNVERFVERWILRPEESTLHKFNL